VLLDEALETEEQDNTELLSKYRQRLDRCGLAGKSSKGLHVLAGSSDLLVCLLILYHSTLPAKHVMAYHTHECVLGSSDAICRCPLAAPLVAAVCRAGVELSKVEVKFTDLNISADVLVGSRAMPTVLNAFVNKPLELLTAAKVLHSERHHHTILKGISGVLKPGRLTLLLGPPGRWVPGKAAAAAVLSFKFNFCS
jgi:hypothetical protein